MDSRTEEYSRLQPIQHIDAIARKKQQGVLWVTFEDPRREKLSWSEAIHGLSYLVRSDSGEFVNNLARQQVIARLDERQIAWEPAAEYTDLYCSIPYQGQIYVDLPCDPNLPAYQELELFLENPDVSKRPPGVRFWVLPLELAMRNAEHDQLDFWDRTMEPFLWKREDEQQKSTNRITSTTNQEILNHPQPHSFSPLFLAEHFARHVSKTVYSIVMDEDAISKHYPDRSPEDVMAKSAASWINASAFTGVGGIYRKSANSAQVSCSRNSAFYTVAGLSFRFTEHLAAQLGIIFNQSAQICCDQLHPYLQAGWTEVIHISTVLKNHKLLKQNDLASQGTLLRNQKP